MLIDILYKSIYLSKKIKTKLIPPFLIPVFLTDDITLPILDLGVVTKARTKGVPESLEITEMICGTVKIVKINSTLPERNINLEYLTGEMKWYNSGSLSVNEISPYSSFWTKLTNEKGHVNSNYDHVVYKQKCPNGKNQFDWCVEKIRDDPDTRQAIINYNQPQHKYDGNKDFVCTISQSFRQRDGNLDSGVVYEKHFKMLDKIASIETSSPRKRGMSFTFRSKFQSFVNNPFHVTLESIKIQIHYQTSPISNRIASIPSLLNE